MTKRNFGLKRTFLSGHFFFSNENNLSVAFHIATLDPSGFDQGFYYNYCSGMLEPDFLVTYSQSQKLPPGTGQHFNKFKEDGGGKFELKSPVLHSTPGIFYLIPSHAERPFIARSPFFYQDDTRTFFVVPRGSYVGGVDTPLDLDLKVKMNVVPMELPDVVTSRVVQYLSRVVTQTRTNDSLTLVSPISNDTLPTSEDLLIESENSESVQPMVATPQIRSILEPAPMITHFFVPKHWEAKYFRFENHYHPYVCLLIEQLNRHGIEGILKPDPEKESHQRRELVESLQRQHRHREFFKNTYKPNEKVVSNVYYKLSEEEKANAGPLEEFDFSYSGAYSIYNWELFFHAPFMLAKRLSDNQRFAEAHRWFNFIFDPIYRPEEDSGESWPERVWQIKPFIEHGVGKSIQRTMLLLKSSGLSKKEKEERKNLWDQIEAWRKNPFNPHLIARMRPEAYMKAVVMSYLDNLIAWGDHLFRQDTMESINEATQLYILAAEILGERPVEIPAHENTRKTINGVEVKTFNDLRNHLYAFSNVLAELETRLYPMDVDGGDSGGIGGLLRARDFLFVVGDNGGGQQPDLPFAEPNVKPEPPDDNPPVLDLPLAVPIPVVLGPTLFFCIPKNDRLLGYWDTVGDRLFKIRHCMNIEGVVRQLPLFQPPIEPGLLVKAAAAGVDISSVLSDLNAPLPHYRFQIHLQKANELINDVKSLGAALLSAMEKKDAEEVSLLRSSHEIRLLEVVRNIKEKNIEESKANVEALKETRKVTVFRHQYYNSRPRTNSKEEFHLKKLDAAFAWQTSSQALELLAGVLGLIPQFDAGVSGAFGTPVVKVEFGGMHLSTAVQVASKAMQLASSIESYKANKASIEAGYDRREDDWKFQATAAEKELLQIDKQIAASEIRIAIAEKDLESHDKQIENAREVDEYMRNKYTNKELYSWMVSQISSIYFQTYKLAYDMAKGAERAFRHELGLLDSNFIQFGYWDSLKKGLLSGEKLQYDLRQLELAYLEQNRREYELTKHISLAMLNPLELLRLKETGVCEVELPEELFDLDYPGHYMRRIKSVSLTIPCVTGPYTTISCTLTLLSNRVRTNTNTSGGYAYTDFEDIRFRHNLGAIQSIATSSGQNDSGLFEFNFRDDRYLPFEGVGAISRWRLEMPNEFRQFDYNTIRDVIIHMNYTARNGGEVFKQAVVSDLVTAVNEMVSGDNPPGLYQILSAKQGYSGEYHRWLHPPQDQTDQSIALLINQQRFPFLFRSRTIRITGLDLLLNIENVTEYASAAPLEITVTTPGNTAETVQLVSSESDFGGLPHGSIDFGQTPNDLGNWTITVTEANLANVAEFLTTTMDEHTRLNPEAIKDLIMIAHYRIEES